MRSSRISQDTAKLFEQAIAPAAVAPRRSSRRSLSRFSYSQHESPRTTNIAATITTDMEDAIAFASPPPKKRRLAASTTGTSAASSPSPPTSPPQQRRQQPRTPRKPATKRTDTLTGETFISPPSEWEVTYNTVKQMRTPPGAASNAAVDSMGCERLADTKASPKTQRFHTLISLMLSSQTKDTVNAVAMHRLKTELPAHKPGAPMGLNLDNVLAVEPGVLNELIWAVGFHNNKTKYIKQAAEVLRDKWRGDIPDTIEGLTSLPGVGPKMAYLCLSAAWGRTEGIGVDVHVHRITNLWGWHKTKNPEETRLALQSWLPRDKWREINWLLVGFGQTVCLPIGRRCGDCDLGLGGLCKAADRKKVIAGRKMREQTTAFVEEDVKGAVLLVKEEKKEEEEALLELVALKQETVDDTKVGLL